MNFGGPLRRDAQAWPICRASGLHRGPSSSRCSAYKPDMRKQSHHLHRQTVSCKPEGVDIRQSFADRVGGVVTPALLPQHRAYGSRIRRFLTTGFPDQTPDAFIAVRLENNRPAGKRSKAWIDRQGAVIQRCLDAMEKEASALLDDITIGEITFAVALGHLDFRRAAGDVDWRVGRPTGGLVSTVR